MIGAVVLHLRAVEPGKIPETQGRLLHAAFFQVLNSYSEELAACIHDNARFKAFTVSELVAGQPVQRNHDFIYVKKGDSFCWRVTVLNDDLLQALTAIPFGYIIRIGSISMSVEDIMMSGDENEAAGILDENQLIAACLSVKQVKQIMFRFSSPVSFRSFKDDYPFPLPHLIFGSLADKWNLADMPVKFNRKEVCEAVSQLLPVSWTGKTEQVFLRTDRGITGFVGEFSFKTDMLPLEKQQMLLLLAQFSFFSGVGRLTGQGLGQTFMRFQ